MDPKAGVSGDDGANGWRVRDNEGDNRNNRRGILEDCGAGG
jgi:hypothetical protein